MTSTLFTCRGCGETHPIDSTVWRFECICEYVTYFEDHLYQGPGVYQHYKGGLYLVFGKGKLEYSEGIHVAYMTLDQQHQQDNWYAGLFCVFRPLNAVDGRDHWNCMVPAADTSPGDDPQMVPRFIKVL